jgi:EAL domain-containing protein (putative c-di-GMP-specific phosphodiesterase class I)
VIIGARLFRIAGTLEIDRSFIAQGVETPEQLAFLARPDCDKSRKTGWAVQA